MFLFIKAFDNYKLKNDPIAYALVVIIIITVSLIASGKILIPVGISLIIPELVFLYTFFIINKETIDRHCKTRAAYQLPNYVVALCKNYSNFESYKKEIPSKIFNSLIKTKHSEKEILDLIFTEYFNYLRNDIGFEDPDEIAFLKFTLAQSLDNFNIASETQESFKDSYLFPYLKKVYQPNLLYDDIYRKALRLKPTNDNNNDENIDLISPYNIPNSIEMVLFNQLNLIQKNKLQNELIKVIESKVSGKHFINSLKKILSNNAAFIVIVGEDADSREIIGNLRRKVRPLAVHSSWQQLFYIEPRKNYSTTEEFLEKEILKGIDKRHAYKVLVIRILPSESVYKINRALNIGFNHFEEIAIHIAKRDNDLLNLLSVTGITINEIVSSANLDFYISDEIEIPRGIAEKIAQKSDAIYSDMQNSLRGSTDFSNLDLLHNTEYDSLTILLKRHIKKKKYDFSLISKMIIDNSNVWYNILTQR